MRSVRWGRGIQPTGQEEDDEPQRTEEEQENKKRKGESELIREKERIEGDKHGKK